MPIELRVAKAHENQLNDPETLLEFESIKKAINEVHIPFVENAVNFVFIKGTYIHSERKMVTACLFVNKMDAPIKELHGILRLRFNERTAQVAKATINFDEPFLGRINPNEALLVHLGIPVKGLDADEVFSFRNMAGGFEDVRVSFAE